MPANSRIIADDATGTVLITDSAHNLSKLKELIQRLDTPQATKQAKDWLVERAKKADTACPPSTASNAQMPQQGVLIALFSLIALVIGFLARGYVIRRIEGGL